MAELEQALRDAAAKGMTHFSLWPTPSNDGKTIYWRAQATPSTAHSYVSVADTDPVKAALNVLEHLPAARRRAAKKEQVTMAVTEAEDNTNETTL